MYEKIKYTQYYNTFISGTVSTTKFYFVPTDWKKGTSTPMMLASHGIWLTPPVSRGLAVARGLVSLGPGILYPTKLSLPSSS